MTPILIATTNQGKLREIAVLLRGLPVKLQSLADLQPIAEPEETERTFDGNARLKAREWSVAGDLLAITNAQGGSPFDIFSLPLPLVEEPLEEVIDRLAASRESRSV